MQQVKNFTINTIRFMAFNQGMETCKKLEPALRECIAVLGLSVSFRNQRHYLKWNIYPVIIIIPPWMDTTVLGKYATTCLQGELLE